MTMALINTVPPLTGSVDPLDQHLVQGDGRSVYQQTGMNPFNAHSIAHLSPSSCALWEAQPALWAFKYLLKKSDRVGAAAHRGSAVEAGVVHGLTTGEPHDTCTRVAVDDFDRRTALSGDSRRDKERDGIAGMVGQGLAELMRYGPPSGIQVAVSYAAEGLAVPIIGYADMVWSTYGVITDLKTLHALPSAIRVSHARQVALYTAAIDDNYRPLVTYCTSKKAATYQVNEPKRHLDAMIRIGQTIQRFVALSRDPMELTMLTTPDFSSFYWSDPATRQAAYEIWKF